MRFLAVWIPVTTTEPIPLTHRRGVSGSAQVSAGENRTAQKYDNGGKPVFVNGDQALKHTATEGAHQRGFRRIDRSKVGVRVEAGPNEGWRFFPVYIEVQDNGVGFTAEGFAKGGGAVSTPTAMSGWVWDSRSRARLSRHITASWNHAAGGRITPGSCAFLCRGTRRWLRREAENRA